MNPHVCTCIWSNLAISSLILFIQPLSAFLHLVRITLTTWILHVYYMFFEVSVFNTINRVCIYLCILAYSWSIYIYVCNCVTILRHQIQNLSRHLKRFQTSKSCICALHLRLASLVISLCTTYPILTHHSHECIYDICISKLTYHDWIITMKICMF